MKLRHHARLAMFLVVLAPRVGRAAATQPATEVEAADGWRYAFGTRAVGPLDDAALGAAYLDGRVTDDTLMWWDGATAWTALSAAPRFDELDRWYTRHGTHEVGPMTGAELRAALASSRAEGRDVDELQVRLAWSDWVTVSAAAPLRDFAGAPQHSVPPPPPPAEVEQPGPAPSRASRHDDDPKDNSRARLTITPRIGLAFPGGATPRQVSRTKVGFGFPLHLDSMAALGDHFELGAYLHYSVRGITERGTAETDGLHMHLLSGGAATKVRFGVSPRGRIRIGATIGANAVWQGFESESESVALSGNIVGKGLNIGASAEYSHDVAPHVALNVQLAMISQVWGRADLGVVGALVEGGSEQPMPFPPLAFLAVGTDFCFGRR